ncbi:MAG TPA: hypothetical protein DCZ43_13085 [candidate division Zixibacteria bacterium]|nr:hypothetical protein [candidate division Zixibacteria bacterium]
MSGGILGKGLGSKVSTLLAAILWGGSMFLIYNKNYATSKSNDLSDVPIDTPLTREFQNWMNVSMGGSKIGYTMQSFSNSPLGYVLKDYSLIRIPLGGSVKEIYLDSYAVLNLDFSIKNFTFGLVSGDYTTDVFGEVRDNKLGVKIKSQNSESESSYPVPKGVYMPGVIPLLSSLRGFPKGEFALPTFDPFSLALNEVQVSIDSEEELNTDNGKQVAHRQRITVSGLSSTMWVDATGHVLREEETGGMLMEVTSREKALDIPEVNPSGHDILSELAVTCQGKIDDPRNIRDLRLQIEGVDPGLFNLSDDFQTVVSTNPLIVEIHTGRIDSSVLADKAPFLAADPFLQVTDPRIVDTSSKIVGSETSPAVETEKLGRWVFESVKKDYAVSLPSAVDVLTVKKGDCNEHTALFTALARAAGIPTKMCIGLVFKDGIFYYHAWPAVHLAGWTPIDPTFGQDRADATHLKLIEGGFERQADLMRVVGKIKITILASPKDL